MLFLLLSCNTLALGCIKDHGRESVSLWTWFWIWWLISGLGKTAMNPWRILWDNHGMDREWPVNCSCQQDQTCSSDGPSVGISKQKMQGRRILYVRDTVEELSNSRASLSLPCCNCSSPWHENGLEDRSKTIHKACQCHYSNSILN